MKCSDISPIFYSISSYNFNFDIKSAEKLAIAKTQYVYRCLFFTGGSVEVCLGEESERCAPGDILFLVPGEEYSFKATEGFSLINLFFDLDESSAGNAKSLTTAIPKDSFDPSRSSKKPYLSDGAALRHNKLFKGVGNSHIFLELLSGNKEDVYFELFSKVAISQLIYNMLISEKKRNNSGAKKILSYINLHVTEDLSAEVLEKKFGYHRNYINKLVKDHTGRTLSQCVRRAKINYAKTLLTEARIPQTQIAEELGYYDYSHFYKAFVSETGISPSEIA